MISTNIQYSNAAIGQHPGVLSEIHSQTKNIAICERNIEHLEPNLAVAIEQPIDFRASGTIQDVSVSLKDYFEAQPHLDEALMQDVLHLLGLFEELTKVSTFRLSLVKVSRTMCPRFHADHNQLRMLCTYLGPGTLWLPDEAVDRKAYRTGKTNESILLNEGLVQQVDTGNLVVLKGSMYPGNNPILHRSPSIGDNGEERILLTMDTNQSMRFPD
ncbi:MAG: DUF1826 domain-containing protein [Bacteroidota bacterium]